MLPPNLLWREKDRTKSLRSLLILLSIGFVFQFVVATSCLGQNWSGILAPSRAIDWSGVGAATPNYTVNCSTQPTLSTGSGNAAANATAIQNAIASCDSTHNVVNLGTGTYYTTSINYRGKSNVVVRGAGANSTFLIFTSANCGNGGNTDVCMEGSNNWSGSPNNSANWTAGYPAGTTRITLSSVTNVVAGSTVMMLDQLDDSGVTGIAIPICALQGTCAQEVPGGAGRPNRAQSEVVLVTAINQGGCGATCVTISPALRSPNWTTGKSPGAWWPTISIQFDGIENVSLDHTTSSPMSGIDFFGCYGCWIKGVRSVTTLGGSTRNHVWMMQSSHVTVRDSYFYGSPGANQSYGVEYWQCSDCLTENNIFQAVSSPVILDGDTFGSVVGYNYATDDYYVTSPTWLNYGVYINHGAGGLFQLAEGNIVSSGFMADSIHGPAHFGTAFRNRYAGTEPGKSADTIPVHVMAFNRYHNFVGNVIGTSGTHTQYEDSYPGGSNANSSNFVFGWSGYQGTTDSGLASDASVATTTMRWGNYDVANVAVRWVATENASGAATYPGLGNPSQTLPASFYLNAKPSWWGTQPWPAIGPDVTGGDIANVGGHAYLTPAANCYLNVMGGVTNGSGGILPFDSTNCYGSVSGGGVQPPSALTATVH